MHLSEIIKIVRKKIRSYETPKKEKNEQKKVNKK